MHIEGFTTSGRMLPTFSPPDVEIGLSSRSQLKCNFLPRLDIVALYSEGITPGREISEEGSPGLAATDGLVVSVDDRHSVLFFRVCIPQKPHPRHSRRECRHLRFRHRFGAGRCASEKHEQAETQRHRRKEMVSPDDHDLLPDGRLGAGSISRRPRNTMAPHCIKYNAWRAVRAA